MVVEPAASDVASPPDEALPRHVAIIMDGNGRWARERGLSRQRGHRAGADRIRAVVERLGEHGVPIVTLFAFSTENWGRPRGEVDYLIHVVVPDIPAFDGFYKRLIRSVDLTDVSTSFAMERIKYTTALPLHYADRG